MKEEEIRPKELFNKYLEMSKKDAKLFDKSEFEKTTCIACNSKNTSLKFIKDGFQYDICNDCGTVFCNPRPSLKVLDEFYQKSKSAKYWFDEFLPKVEEARREKIFKKKAIQLFELVKEKNINVNKFCDVGAGSRIFIEELHKIRKDIFYYAIEPGDVSSEIIKEKGITVLQKSVELADDWEEKFDFVVSLEVLEHVNSPLNFVESLNKLLVDGGYCLVTSLGYEGFDILTLGEKSNSISPPHHLNFPSIEGFEKLFKSAGFAEVYISTPGVLDVDIVINSDIENEFIRVLKKRGDNIIERFQTFLINNNLSSHVWILAKK